MRVSSSRSLALASCCALSSRAYVSASVRSSMPTSRVLLSTFSTSCYLSSAKLAACLSSAVACSLC